MGSVARDCHSAAALILAAADMRSAGPMATFRLHSAGYDPSVINGWMDAAALRRLADLAEASTDRLVADLSARCPAPHGFWRDAIAGERTLGAFAALRAGLVHSIAGGPVVVPERPRAMTVPR
jgi:ATP-dependent protease ClpP protease subunit